MKSFFLGLLTGVIFTISGYFLLSDRQSKSELLTLKFTEAEVQEKLSRKFPREEKILGLIQIIIEEPKVSFMGSDNRIRLATSAQVLIPFVKKEEIRATFSSSLRYQPEDHTLRISDYEIEEIATDRLPDEYEGPVRAAFTVAARELLDDQIVHTVDDKEFEGKLTRLFLQELKVKKGTLEVVLGL
jgi:hypothetical protein